jgi:hypothetical protein
MAAAMAGYTILPGHVVSGSVHKVPGDKVNIVAVTRPPKQYYFGYYTKKQFDPSDRYLLGLECGLIGRLQRAEDNAVLGIIDLKKDYQWIPLADTTTWSWQMGCMAEWLPKTDKKIIYNDRHEGKFVSIIRTITGDEHRILPNPIFEIHPDGKSALTLNFSRLWDLRPETGYPGLTDPWFYQPAPEEDGVFSMDLDTGRTILLISHADMTGFPSVTEMPPDSKRYFTHLLFNEDGSRFMFWYRCRLSTGKWLSGVYTASPNGKDIYFLSDKNSHCTWLGRDKVLAWATHKNTGQHTYLFRDQKEDFEIIGEGLLNFNGHSTFSPNKRFLITDIPPNQKNEQTLVLYNFTANSRIDIGHFHSMPELMGELRCDLHPRWNRSGSQVCIDSVHEGSRQMYLIDVSGITW